MGWKLSAMKIWSQTAVGVVRRDFKYTAADVIL